MGWLHDLAHATSAAGKIGFAIVGVIAFLAVIGLVLLLVDRAPKTGREKIQAFLFLLPALVLLLIGLIAPIVRTVQSSLTSGEVDRPGCVPIASLPKRCVLNEGGACTSFANFNWIFTNDDPTTAFWNTLLWTLLAPAPATAIGLGYAYAIEKIRGEGFAKALVFLPAAI